MNIWPAFSDELNKMAIAKGDPGPTGPRADPGSSTAYTKDQINKIKENIRKHLGRPDVAARVQARRKRTELFSDVDNIIRKAQKVKGRRLGVLGNIMKVLGGVTAGGAAGYLLGKKGKKESTNEPARTA